MPDSKLYLHFYHLHGLFRSRDLELGRDADTGGQTKYVLELVQAASRLPEVAKIDVMTRRIEDPRVHPDYSRPIEHINRKARIIRIRCGGKRYRRKETLWPYLDEFVDNVIRFVRSQSRIPHVLHAHYADGGYVASQLARFFGLPLVFTGHSLGRSKLERLVASGMSEAAADRKYHIHERIAAEESTLKNADLVVTSTRQERDTQYDDYEHRPTRVAIIPPGIDTATFRAYTRAVRDPDIRTTRDTLYRELDRFHMVRSKPLILSLARPDYRKNIPGLVRAYGSDAELRKQANLAIFAGIRKDIRTMEDNERDVLMQLLLLMDIYDLYGRMAIPKRHDFATEVPELYRIAARSRGVFVNVALTEPFGLTLIEAAATGLPVVATNDGGPQEILEKCEHGILVDAKDEKAIAEAIRSIITDRDAWARYSRNGIEGVARHYTWKAHTARYLSEIRGLSPKQEPFMIMSLAEIPIGKRLYEVDRLLITDIDNTLIGDRASLDRLIEILEQRRGELAFGVATGRRIDSARAVLAEHGLPAPDIIIASVGAEIYTGNDPEHDRGWARHISHAWAPDAIRLAMADIKGAELQEPELQRAFKLSYYIDLDKYDGEAVRRQLSEARVRCNMIESHQRYLDFLPHRASKGRALRYLAFKWDIPPGSFVTCGDSGNDREMLAGNMLSVVVANYAEELESLRQDPKSDIYFSPESYAAGIIDGLVHYGVIRAEEATSLELAAAARE